MLLIDNQPSLDDICNYLKQESIISIDTEFERRTTYYAKPSIIQIVTKNHKVIIDCLAKLDLNPFRKILADEKILKILHSGREDFEIFHSLFNELPKNVFDTQIAAKVCGFGTSLSYSDLCAQICDVEINKTYQKANWMKRPLKSKMLEYAINDAMHLEKIYFTLRKTIEENNLQNNLFDAMQILQEIKNYKVNLTGAWQKVSFTNRSKDFVEKMKILAAFREECASDAEVPRKHFLNDEDLVKICLHLPTTNSKLEYLELNSQHIEKSKYKNKLFDLCAGLNERI